MIVTIRADGEPRTKGSWTVINGHWFPGRTPDAVSAFQAWTELLQVMAVSEMGGRKPRDGALRMEALFVLPPSSKKRRLWPTSQRDGDLSKYVRAAEDALEGIVYTNDARIAELHATKRYVAESGGERPYAIITVADLST